VSVYLDPVISHNQYVLLWVYISSVSKGKYGDNERLLQPCVIYGPEVRTRSCL